MSAPFNQRRGFRRIYVLPSLLTLGNFSCGFFSIVFCLNALFFATRTQVLEKVAETPSARLTAEKVNEALKSDDDTKDIDRRDVLAFRASKHGSNARAIEMFHWACVIIFLGMAFDMLDGGVARRMGASSAFGVELDSLADVVSFGIAPPTIVTTLWISAMPLSASWWGQVMIFGVVYAACAVLRLARYNIQSGMADKNTFSGLPSPAAAGCVVTAVLVAQGDYFFVSGLCEWIASTLGLGLTALQVKARILAVYLLLPGLLMVSTVPYTHVANRYFSGKKSYSILVLAVLLLALVWHEPRIMLFLLFNGYLLVGIVLYLRKKWLRRPGSIGGADTQRVEAPAPKKGL